MARYDARYLARGWLSVALAASADRERPALCKTVSIERFPWGVRLVSTDSYVLLRAWVPDLDHPDYPEPTLDEVPYARAVAIDQHGRGKGFMAHVLKLSAGEDAPLVEVDMGLGVYEAADGPPSLGGMEARWVVLDHPDHERLKLPAYEGDFPSWRQVVDGFERVSTSVIALNPEIVGRLAKLGKLNGGASLVWHFGGETRMARVEVMHSEPHVEGLVMPVLWNFDGNQPESERVPAGVPPEDDAPETNEASDEPPPVDEPEEEVDLEDAAMRVVVQARRGSESLLMEKLGVGATTAARLIDLLEVTGVVGPPKGAAPRDVLMPVEELEQLDALKGARVIDAESVDA